MRAPPTDTPPARAPHSRPGRVRPTLGPCQLTAELKATIRVLIVDDDRTLRESCASVLQYEGYQVSLCSRGDEARETLKRNKFDIVLLDLYMPEVSGLRLLRTCLEAHSDTIVLVITGNPSVDSSLDALRAGAWDYLPKPFSATHLQILVGRAAHTVTVARESLAVQAEFEREHGNSEHVTVLGASPAFRRAVGLARRVAPTEASVFITGESGSGKEVIAQFIHHHSRRSSRPLVAVKPGALGEALSYRLRVVPIHVPPLRERPADIQLLAEYFLKQYWTRHRGATVAVPRLSEAALRALRARPWKGNVRELENVVEHLVVLLEPGDEVAPDAIPALGDELATEASATLLREVTTEEPYYDARDRLVAEFELRYLSQLVSQAGGNMSRAARAARVDRTTLYRLLERHGLHRRPVDPPDDEGVTRM